MRILFLAPAFPLPPNNGLNMRTWAVVRGLAAEGHPVTFLALGQPGEMTLRSELQANCSSVETVSLARPSLSSSINLRGRLRSLGDPRPYGVTRFLSTVMRQRIASRLATGTFDAIVCDPYSFVNLPPTRLPILLQTHNVEHVILRRYLSHARDPIKLAYAWLEYRKMRLWEAAVCRRATIIMACSDVDRQGLRSLGAERPVVIVPNVIDSDTYSAVPEPNELTVLYQGGMDWYPNRDAVEFFVCSIFPMLRSAVPSVRFVVAGRNPSETFMRRFRGVAGVEFTGTLPDMRDAIARATVCVVPLRIGSGTRLKILEAAAMGKPVISTTIGAEGLTFIDGEDIVIADDPTAFAKALVCLLTDPSRRRALGSRARRRLEMQYGFDNLRQGIRKVFEELACTPALLATAPRQEMHDHFPPADSR